MTPEEKQAIQAMFYDPAGVALKMSEGKPRLSLVPIEAMAALAKVYEYGLIKYERDSWRRFTSGQAKECLPDSALRHLMLYCSGEAIDPESGLHHLAQAAWNCLTLLIVADAD